METVEHIADLNLILIGEHLTSIEILIGRYLVTCKKSHDDEEQVLSVLVGLIGIVEGWVLAFCKVKNTVNNLGPLQVGLARLVLLEERLLPTRYLYRAVFLLVLTVLAVSLRPIEKFITNSSARKTVINVGRLRSCLASAIAT